MRQFLFFLCALLCAFATSASLSSAQTQTTPIDDVRANSRTHAGPFYVTPSILLSDFGVDNNVFNQAQNPKSDFTFTLVPKANVAIPVSHRALFQVDASAYLVYYQDYASERSIDPRVAPRAEVFLNKLSFFAEGSYLRTRQRPSFEIDTRSLRTERYYGGGIGYRYSPKLSFQLGARDFNLKYDANEEFLNVSLQETLNRDSLIFTGSARYNMTAFTTIALRADTSQDRFPYSPVRNADTIRVMPGVEFNPRALVTGSAYVGFRNFRTKSDLLDDFKGMVATASLGYTMFGRTTFIATADRDLTYSFEPLQPYYVVNSYGLSVRHRLVGKLDVRAGAVRYQYEYRHLLVIESGETFRAPDAGPRVDLTRNYSASIGYTVGPDIRVGFGTSIWRRTSNVAAYRDFDDARTGFSLTYGF